MFGLTPSSLASRGAPDELAADNGKLARMGCPTWDHPRPQLLSDSGTHVLGFFNENQSAKGEVPNETVEFRSWRHLWNELHGPPLA
jgi:hypothetical protein